jgi:hypothetical protein
MLRAQFTCDRANCAACALDSSKRNASPDSGRFPRMSPATHRAHQRSRILSHLPADVHAQGAGESCSPSAYDDAGASVTGSVSPRSNWGDLARAACSSRHEATRGVNLFSRTSPSPADRDAQGRNRHERAGRTVPARAGYAIHSVPAKPRRTSPTGSARGMHSDASATRPQAPCHRASVTTSFFGISLIALSVSAICCWYAKRPSSTGSTP